MMKFRKSTAATVLFTLIAVLGSRALGWWQPAEWWLYDVLLRRRASVPASRIAIVGITEADLQRFGFPLNDALLAQAVAEIDRHNPRAIGLDLYRDLPHEPGHQALSALLRENARIVGVQYLVGAEPGGPKPAVPPPPALPPERVAVSDLVVDGDGIVRRTLLRQGRFPSLGFELARLYLAAEGLAPEYLGERVTRIAWGEARYRRLQVRTGPYQGVDAGGFQVLLDYQGPSVFAPISFGDLIDGRFDPSLFRDRVVVLGSVAASSQDRVMTPYSHEFWSWAFPSEMTGVELQAHVTASILAHVLDGRPVLQAVPEVWEWLWLVGWLGAFGGGVLFLNRRKTGVLVAGTSLGALAGGGTISAMAIAAFEAGWWMPLAPPVFGILAVAIASLLVESLARARDYTRNLEATVARRSAELYNQRYLVEVGNLARGIFHDLNSPLALLNTYILILEKRHNEGCNAAETQEYIEELKSSILATFRVHDTVSQALNLRPMQRRDEHQLQTEDTISLGVNIVRANTSHEIAQQVRYDCQIDPSLPSTQASQGEILRLILNLADNAYKAVARKSKALPGFDGCIRVRAWEEDAGLALEVSDNGPGLPPALLAALNSWSHAENGNKAKIALPLPEGSFGLHAVTQILDSYHGSLAVKSSVDNGTMFKVFLPSARALAHVPHPNR